jgi:DNA-binding response OmpR family regulator
LPDGEAAIAYLSGAVPYNDRSSHPLPMLLLLDINLPLVSGLEVLSWVRSQNAIAALPTLMLTSSCQPSDLTRAYEIGANGYLVKPSGLAKLSIMAQAIHDFWLVQNQPPPPFCDPNPTHAEADELQFSWRGNKNGDD